MAGGRGESLSMQQGTETKERTTQQQRRASARTDITAAQDISGNLLLIFSQIWL